MKILFINPKRKNIKMNQRIRKHSNKVEGIKIKENLFNMILKKNQIVLLAISLMLITAGYMNYNNNINNTNISVADLGDAKLVSGDLTSENNIITENIVMNTNSEAIENTNINSENSNENVNSENNEKSNANVNLQIDTNIMTDNNKNVDSKDNLILNDDEKNQVNSTIETSAGNTENKTNISQNTTNYFTQTKLERSSMYSQMLETYQKILENEKIPSDQKSIAASEIKNINDRQNAILIIENLIKNKGFENSVILVNDDNIDAIVKSNMELTTEQVAQIEDIVSRELKAEIQDIHISTHK